MNETIRTILARRSVREYQSKQIEPELLAIILEAATYAPSAINAQDWHFLVLQNQNHVEKLNTAVKEAHARSADPRMQSRGKDPNFHFAFHAPALVIVSYKKETRSSVPLADCAAALQNIFLAARSLEIGSCWINVLARLREEEQIQQALNEVGVPADNLVYGCAALGYPRGQFPAAPERKGPCITIKK